MCGEVELRDEEVELLPTIMVDMHPVRVRRHSVP